MYKVLFLSQDQFSLVDESLYDELSTRSWYYATNGYATSVKLKSDPDTYPNRLGLHSYIMFLATGVWSTRKNCVDHINRNKLDNRLSNLRFVTHNHNIRNTKPRGVTGFKGVYKRPNQKRWYAQIGIDGDIKHLGMFDSAESAAQAYDDIVWELHHDFKLLNFPKLKQ